MKKLLSAATVITALALVAPRLAAVGNKPTPNTTAIVGSADAFLATLTPEQRTHVLYAFNDTGQRGRWSNFPTGVVPRGGISLRQMSAPQQEATMKLLSIVLSPIGLQK